ncbi:hypothetical protein J6590_004284 [Homalodisca vitripennis]|nr:hypothetical protein J6590_004284 [Homalodisca vitripennis]
MRLDSWSYIRVKRSKERNNEEAQNGTSTSFRHQRHLCDRHDLYALWSFRKIPVVKSETASNTRRCNKRKRPCLSHRSALNCVPDTTMRLPLHLLMDVSDMFRCAMTAAAAARPGIRMNKALSGDGRLVQLIVSGSNQLAAVLKTPQPPRRDLAVVITAERNSRAPKTDPCGLHTSNSSGLDKTRSIIVGVLRDIRCKCSSEGKKDIYPEQRFLESSQARGMGGFLRRSLWAPNIGKEYKDSL